MTEIKKGSELNLEIESLAFGGQGVARVGDFVIFVNRALPGQNVRIRIYKKKASYAEARVLEVIKESPLAVSPRCPHFGVCGGCLWQNLNYETQLEYKREHVRDSLERIGGFSNIKTDKTLPSNSIFFYRNKMEYSFSHRRWKLKNEEHMNAELKSPHLALGLHIIGRYDKVLNIENCFLMSETSNCILGQVRSFAIKSNLRPYNTKDHSGFWRFLMIREGKQTSEVMVNLVTAEVPEYYPVVDELADALTRKLPAITTVVHNINKKKAQIAFGDEERILKGSGVITEKLGKYKFQISANSFFQTNTHQAEKLYNKIIELARFDPDEIVYDFYSGTGSIAIFISHLVKKVVGFELLEDAVKDAERNCKLNGVENCVFVSGDLKEHLSDVTSLALRFGRPDVIVIDPPRAGMHPQIPSKVNQLSPRKIVCVSCNPATLARDLKLLSESYQIEMVQPVDMFPHTPHCEAVVLLSRKN